MGFAELLSRSGFNFPDHVILSLVKAADVNEDGVIEYEEFVPAMLGLMEACNEDDHTPDVGEGVPMWDEVPADMLERYLEKLFQIGDTNGDGVLQPVEFLELLTRAGLRFPANLVLKLFLEADTNHDGVIEYDEFMPAMLAVIESMKDGITDAAVEEFAMPNPADVPADMMADYLQKLFKVADSNDDGVLSPIEFAELLSRSGFNFPDHVILSLVKAADVNEDGVIEYEEFVPAMLALMEACNEDDHTPDVGEGVPMWDEVPADMLERYLAKLFQIGDTNGDGVLQPVEFLELLTRAGLRFPPKLVLKLFLEADTNHDGVIEYDEFMPAMLAVIDAMREPTPSAPPAPAAPPAPPAPSGDYESEARDFLLRGMDRNKLERTILRSFLFADTKNTGVLDESEFASCIQDLGLGLTPSHIAELMRAVDKNEDGVIAYDEWVPLAFELMVRTIAMHLASENQPAAAPSAKPQSGAAWKAIATSYEPAPAPSPVVRPKVTAAKGPVPELEGRVHALQSRRLLRGWVKELFAELDADMDGRLSEEELSSSCGLQMARQMIKEMDRNQDGKLSQVEVRDYFDAEATKAVHEKGIPEWEYLQSVVEMLKIC